MRASHKMSLFVVALVALLGIAVPADAGTFGISSRPGGPFAEAEGTTITFRPELVAGGVQVTLLEPSVLALGLSGLGAILRRRPGSA